MLGVADLARADRAAGGARVGRRLADAARRRAARARRDDLALERRVHEVRDAAARPAVLVRARVGRRVLGRKHVEEGGGATRTRRDGDARGGDEVRRPHRRGVACVYPQCLRLVTHFTPRWLSSLTQLRWLLLLRGRCRARVGRFHVASPSTAISYIRRACASRSSRRQSVRTRHARIRTGVPCRQ